MDEQAKATVRRICSPSTPSKDRVDETRQAPLSARIVCRLADVPFFMDTPIYRIVNGCLSFVELYPLGADRAGSFYL